MNSLPVDHAGLAVLPFDEGPVRGPGAAAVLVLIHEAHCGS